MPAYAGLHSIDRSRPQWNMIGNWTHTTGTMVIDTQVASNRFTQGDLRKRLHEFKPSDMGLPTYLNDHCASQGDCMLPVVNIGGYQGISGGTSSFDRARNLQGTVNLTKVTSNHTLRGGVDARVAQRLRSPGGNPSGLLELQQRVHRQASDTSQLTPSNLGLSMAAFMLGIPNQSQVTIQRVFSYRNNYLGAYGQDSWRVNGTDGQLWPSPGMGETASRKTTTRW